MNETHDPKATSWVESANQPGTDFPIQNLPLGVFVRPRAENAVESIGVAIGDQILNLSDCAEEGLLADEGAPDELSEACVDYGLNALMELDSAYWANLRSILFQWLKTGSEMEEDLREFLVPMREAQMLLPAEIGDYTDFYASVFHATNVGSMFRPNLPLLPNYKWVPIAYHGRASSIVISGTPVKRPCGQTQPGGEGPPTFGSSRRLDYELELGCYIGGPENDMGEPVPISRANERFFGVCLVNDWSARDVQAWEYQPLGPFLAKNFATTVSPWVVMTEALEPFRVPAFVRPDGDPAPLPHLTSEEDQRAGGFDITLEVHLATRKMREQGIAPVRLSRSHFRDMYWTLAQMITHHASNGCNLIAGDLLASGTVSGPEKDARGCLLELTWKGTEPLQTPSGETRKFLEDGDEVILRGYCEREGAARIGLGECRGTVT
jgi:fumarylacetoacetase